MTRKRDQGTSSGAEPPGAGRVAPKGGATGGDDRETRRARQLRANLRRRKGQQRARASRETDPKADG